MPQVNSQLSTPYASPAVVSMHVNERASTPLTCSRLDARRQWQQPHASIEKQLPDVSKGIPHLLHLLVAVQLEVSLLPAPVVRGLGTGEEESGEA